MPARKPYFRRLERDEAPRAADFLDSRALILRWQVAFLRNRNLLPEEQEYAWAFWAGLRPEPDDGREAPARDPSLACVLVHFFPTATLYICGDPDTDLRGVEQLCREELLPERIIGEPDLLNRWRGVSPGLFEKSVGASDLTVVVFEGTGECAPPGFRRARPEDLPLVEEFDRMLATEIGEDPDSDLSPLVEAGLVHVLEEDGRIEGSIRSNFPDGRYVHGGGVFVHPLYRGRGVGTRLAKGLGVTVRREQGLPALLDVYSENARAMAAYRKAGYVPRGRGLEIRLPEDAWKA